jgi:hypothetical protein
VVSPSERRSGTSGRNIPAEERTPLLLPFPSSATGIVRWVRRAEAGEDWGWAAEVPDLGDRGQTRGYERGIRWKSTAATEEEGLRFFSISFFFRVKDDFFFLCEEGLSSFGTSWKLEEDLMKTFLVINLNARVDLNL